MQTFQLAVPCLLGVEGLVADELRQMGAENVQAENGRVLCAGSPEMLARANLSLRCGERVQVLLGSFPARTFDELFEGVRALPWERWIGRDDAFPVKGRTLSSKLHSLPDCQKIIKKAIVERLHRQYGLTSFPETGRLYQVQFLLLKDRVSLLLDTSGQGLHKRGYRKTSTIAPIKETLAAALVTLSRVRTDASFYDPCCGSGTLLIEGALYATHTAPGLSRRFSAEAWPQVPARVWQRERERAKDLILRDAAFCAYGSDIDPAAVALTLENAKKAGVGARVRAVVRDLKDFSPHTEYGCVVCNPPYGERLLDVEAARTLYRTMGRVFPQRRGFHYTIISPDETFESCFGRRADRRRKLYNGMLKCQAYLYYKAPRAADKT